MDNEHAMVKADSQLPEVSPPQETSYPTVDGTQQYLQAVDAWQKALPALLRVGLSAVDNSSIIDFGGTPYLEGRPGGAPALAAALGISVRFLRNERNERVYRIDDLGDGDYTVEVEIEATWNVCGHLRTVQESGHSGTLKKFWVGDGEKIKHRYHEYLAVALGVSQSNEAEFRAAMEKAMPQQILKAKKMLLADIKKQAVANAWSRVITRILGVKLTWEGDGIGALKKYGITKDNSGANIVHDGVKIKCPKCGKGWMRKRSGKSGDFYGCSAYPKCRNTMQVDEVEAVAESPEEEAGAGTTRSAAGISKDLADDLKDRWEAAGLKSSDLTAHCKEIGISKLGDMTPAQWREAVEKAYVKAILKNPSMGRADADAHLEDEFKKKHPADLTNEKFRQLIGWINSQVI